MSEDKSKLLEERGWTAEKIAQFRWCKDINPRRDISLQQFGELFVVNAVGYLKDEIVWACNCKCGNRTLKTTRELTAGFYPNCGCLEKGDGFEYWQKNRDKLHAVWRDNFIRFRKECYELREDRKHLNRKFRDRKLGPHNFFWSNHTEKQHQIHDKVVDILIIDEALTRQAAKEKAVLMSAKAKRNLIERHKENQARDYDLQFMRRYGKRPPLKEVPAKRIKLPTNALYSLAKLLEQSKYDEPELEFLFTDDNLFCRLSKLPMPIGWNNEKQEWDL